jgi:hypothetical protein
VPANTKNAVAVGTIPQMWALILPTLSSAIAASAIYLVAVSTAHSPNQIRLL